MVGGFWASVPGLDDPSEAGQLPFTAATGGNDPFHGANIETLKGRASYRGDAFGLYASRNPTPAFRHFSANVRLTADFNYNRVHGVVLDGRDTATDERLFAGLELHDADIRTDGPGRLRGTWKPRDVLPGGRRRLRRDRPGGRHGVPGQEQRRCRVRVYAAGRADRGA